MRRPLHDIGKIAIADAILSKPGKLTPEEMAIMRTHVTIGARILENGSSDLIKTAELIAQSHHERWDGAGYPDKLSGTDIPIEARVVAIADVFDALCSERPYKKAWPIEKAYAEIIACSGTHFDPACVTAFRDKWAEIQVIMQGEPTPRRRRFLASVRTGAPAFGTTDAKTKRFSAAIASRRPTSAVPP